jgi:tape measure domain-containing protein
MAGIDDKVVAISFESSKFEQGVNKTIASIEKLKKSLNFPEAGKNLLGLSKAAAGVNLGHIAKAADDVTNRLRTLSVVGLAVLANLATQAVRTGLSFIKSLTIAPITQGFQEYQTQLNAVQTILSNTAQAGTNLKDVNAALNQLNHYADKTIYNFTQMTKNIGTFTAAGVDLESSVSAIKGISNLAAVSGSNAEQASTAMYQLSQALSSGTVKLQDWNSVVNAGMGGTFFQRALAQNAVHMGTLNEKAVKLSGSMKNVTINGESFRQSLASAGPGKTSWLTGKVLINTLNQLSGDMTKAQLKAQGYTDAQIKAIQTQAKMALEAATQVKTLSQLIDTTKEAVGSGWAQTWMIIFGDFGEAKRLFTGLSNAINGFVSQSANARNKVLKDWKKLGGRTLLIDSLKQAFQDLAAVVRPIRDAFRDIFPATTGKNLFDLTVRFKELTERLKPGQTTIENLRRTFRGIFAILDIGKQIIGGIFSVFAKMFGAVAQGRGDFLSLTAGIGDFLVKVDNALKKGDRLKNFFDLLGSVLAGPVQLITNLRAQLIELFTGISPGGFSGTVDNITQSLTPFQQVLEGIKSAWESFMDSVPEMKQIIQPVVDAIIESIQSLGPAISSAIQSMSWEPILAVIRTGLLGGIFLLLRNFFGKGSLIQQIGKGFSGGILANIAGSFGALKGSLTAIQNNVRAKTLKEIAIAVALLAASVVALSFVDPKKLNSSMSAITLMFAQLLGAMAIMDKITTSGAFLRLPFVAASLVILAGAIDILALAVAGLSLLSWEQLAKGLGAVTVLLVGLTAAAGPLSANSAGMIRAGVGITAIAIGLNIMAAAVALMGSMNLSTLAKGLIGISVGLEAIAFSMQAMPKGMVLQAAALIGIALALRLLGEAVSKFGGMDMDTIAKGMGSIGAALLIIGVAMRVMPTNMALQAAGLLLVAVALQGIVRAVGSLGGMSIEQLAKGLISLAAALVILATGLIMMEGSLPGAFALTVAAAGLALLTPALIALGKQSWTSIIKGLVALAAALTVLALASIVLSEAVPFMLALGVALVAIGAGLALAGAGIFLIGAGLAAIAVSGSAAAAVIVEAFINLVQGITENAKLLVLGLLEIVQAFADTAPEFVAAVVKILSALLDGIVQLMPKVEPAVIALITTLISIIHQQQGPIIQAGFDLLLAFLQGIRRNIPAIVTLVADIIVAFLNSLASQMPRIARAGVNVLIGFIKGVASAYGLLVTAAVNFVVKIVQGIANNIRRIVTAGANIVINFVRGIGQNARQLVTAGGTAIANFIQGIGNAGRSIINAGVSAATKLINALVRGVLTLIDVGARAIVTFLNGVADAIENYEPQMIKAGARIGVAIVRGMIQGLADVGHELITAAGNLAQSAIDGAKKKLHLKSPSKIFEDIGKNVVLGFANGLSDTKDATEAAATMSNGVIDAVKSIFQIASASKVMEKLARDVTAGFALGLKNGAKEEIQQAFKDVNALVTQQIADANKKIKDAKQRQAELRKDKLKSSEEAEYKKLNAVIEENNKILNRSKRFHKELTKEISAHKVELIGLSAEYEKTSSDLEVATSLFERYLEQYSDLPDIPSVDEQGAEITDPLSAYIEKLTEQVGSVEAYKQTLDALKGLGLDDKTYQMLLDQGPSAQKFASQLLAAGKPVIDQVNKLDVDLGIAASGLADNAAKELYDVGKAAAQGFVKGLQDHKAEILTEMSTIADAMVDRIKKKLKIKSPSEIFSEIGVQSMEGMAQGITDASSLVGDSMDDAAQNALDAMRKNMRDLSSVISEEVDTSPVITPILDLTQVKAKSQELAALTDVNAVASFGQATAISSERAQTEAEQVAVAGGTSVKFEQNNYSPEALTEVEIYRQTKNQLSQIKSALAIA